MTSHRLPRSTPEAESVPSGAVAAFFAALDELQYPHSAKVLRHGRVIAEATWSPYQAERRHSMFSVSKSFTSMAIGLLVHEGRLSLDDLVVDLLPDELPAEISPHLAALRLRHVLEMTVGHEVEPFTDAEVVGDLTWAQYVLAAPIPREPGTHWIYNTPSTYLLSCIVQAVTGGRMLDYLMPRLFDPLGIRNPVWEQSPEGVDTGGSGLSITIEDLAVFGQLLLQRGQWAGKQVIPAEWIDEASTAHADNRSGPGGPIDWQQGYGNQFWRCRHGAYRGDGAFGQFVVVMPEQDAVFVMTAGLDDMQPVLEHLWTLLAEFDREGPVAEIVSERALEVPEGELRDVAVEYRYDGPVPRVRVAGDLLELGDVAFTLRPGGWTSGVFWGQPVAVAGGWNGDALSVLLRMVETPFAHLVRLDAAGHLSISIDRSFTGPGEVWSGDPWHGGHREHRRNHTR
jgi:CubicO group peptidase (beta-lactamase class C family)